MAVKTSITHPLQIGEVGVPSGGVLGLTFCPGKCQPNSTQGNWQRDLAIDLDLVKAWGAAAVVTLMPTGELQAVKVGHVGDEVEARGMEWHHLPIRDVDVPDDAFERLWTLSGLRLRMHLLGHRQLLECRP